MDHKSTTLTVDSPAPKTGELVSPETDSREATFTWQSKLGAQLHAQLKFAVVALEFGLLVVLAERFHLESQTFYRVFLLAFAGFLVHHYLPTQLKLPFFAFLSIFVTVAVVDSISTLSLTGPGAVLIALGMTLLGVCHLPIPFAARVALLLALGGAITVARANFQWFPSLEGIWPVLASMFIFRLMVYMYDLKHQSAKFSLSRGVSYFFMLPNACFPLYPIVDYKTFCSTYFNDNPITIYQTGIKWMFRGIVQLLLYRLVYQFGLLNISDVRNLGDVAEFMVATYLLYLRVSGQFHLIVGLLHMFGFNLPETHHLYYLASSFTDFWRRINIYWKDFIMKLFFYPAFFALRKLGTVRAIGVGTLLAFVATWALHSWQWFWFRGQFLLSWQDITFWTILALLVVVNAVFEALRGSRRTLSPPKFDSSARLIVGLKTMATFCVICALWALWSARSMDELWVLAESSTQASWRDVLGILLGLTALGLGGAIFGSSRAETSLGATAQNAKHPVSFWPSAIPIAIGSVMLLLTTGLSFSRNTQTGSLLYALQHDQLNSRDIDCQRRGYYEELDVARETQFMWASVNTAPPGWTDNDRLFRDRNDFIHREMIPGAVGQLCGTQATVNRWGMRDRDYSFVKPAATKRLALFGSSHEVGSGVRDEETFENIVEDELNGLVVDGHKERFEILNFSVGGYSMFEKLRLLEERAFDFKPDVVLFTVCTGDRPFILEQLANVASAGKRLPYEYLKQLFQQEYIDSELSSAMIQHRLDSHVTELYRWVFTRLGSECEQRGIQAFVIFRPAPLDGGYRDVVRRKELLDAASEAGVQVVDLNAAFDQVEDRSTLVLADWDDHTNATGHRLLADELFKQLAPLVGALNDHSQASP